MRTLNTVLICVVLFGLGSCQSAHPPKDDDGMSWAAEPMPKPINGSIYQSGREVALFENPIAHHVGDIVTIVLNEQTAAQKSSSTNTNKATTVALPGMTLLGKALTVHGVPILSNNIADTTKFAGEGDSAQSNSLQGFITVTVQKVLPNGNLYVKGEKWISINQGQEYVRMTGVIRPIDLSAENSVPSSQVANAKIAYGGKGALADSNAQGWLSRFFNSPWSPF
ncbi:MAG TPA: flagellar basal body L-ring protein FlgH [Steroidobacteraceae bacterium]